MVDDFTSKVLEVLLKRESCLRANSSIDYCPPIFYKNVRSFETVAFLYYIVLERNVMFFIHLFISVSFLKFASVSLLKLLLNLKLNGILRGLKKG